MIGVGSRAAALVVDDEEGMRDLLSFILTRDGLHVVTASGALDALAQFAARKFDFVITDMMMPEMNGLEPDRAAARARPGGGDHHVDRATRRRR